MTKLTKLQELYNQRTTFESAIHMTFELLPYAMNKENPEIDDLNTIFSKWNSVKWYKDFDHWESSPDWSDARDGPLNEYDKQRREFEKQQENDAKSYLDQITGGFAKTEVINLQKEIEDLKKEIVRLRTMLDAYNEPQP